MSRARRGLEVEPSSRASENANQLNPARDIRHRSGTAETRWEEELTLVTTQIHEILENIEHSNKTRKDENLLSGRQNVLEHLVEEDELARGGDDVFFDCERLGFGVGKKIPVTRRVSDTQRDAHRD